ncbi:MAG TPA: dephospho-CoA kinase, partial [Thermoanaerobaculia bacterium]|nr:dephospho-CoA kinase [Thermoanaerobaculia bacterium]
MILRVGLTGGIASGKSTARALFGALGCHVIDADKLVADLYEPGRAGHAALVAAYGRGILRPDATIDRAKLADIAFADPEEAKKLNALIQPIV